VAARAGPQRRRDASALAAVLVRDNAPELRAPSRRRSCSATLAAVDLLAELDAFFTDHRLCGDLDPGVGGPMVWFDCECGARIARRADDGDAFDVDT
jgi:hypothetical protein